MARGQQLDLLDKGVGNNNIRNAVEVKNNKDRNVSVDTSTNMHSNTKAIKRVGDTNGTRSNVVVNNYFYNSPNVTHR